MLNDNEANKVIKGAVKLTSNQKNRDNSLPAQHCLFLDAQSGLIKEFNISLKYSYKNRRILKLCPLKS